MDEVLQDIVEKLNDYVGNLIDVTAMSEDDRAQLKSHLLAAEQILLRNGNLKLHEVINSLTAAVLDRLR